jgi:hypothetical protein
VTVEACRVTVKGHEGGGTPWVMHRIPGQHLSAYEAHLYVG